MPEHNGRITQHNVVTKIPTGIPGFDHITEGGVPQHRSTLVSGTSGSAKTVLAIQFLYSGIVQHGEGGIFVTFEESPDDLRRNVRSFGWDLERLEQDGRLAIIDVSPIPGHAIIEAGDYDFAPLMARIEHAARQVKAKRVAIDSINALFYQFPDSAVVRREMYRLSAGLKALGLTALITAERTDEFGEVSRFAVEEFVADNVIVLRNMLEEEKRRRTIEVLKYRGASHRKGEFPFTVSQDGIEVLPLSIMEPMQACSDERISTGCEELDSMCGGGYFRGSIILISGATGTGKTLAVTTFLHHGSQHGEKTLVFAFEESRNQLLRNAISWGMDFQKWEEQGLLKIVCAYPESTGLEDHLLKMKREIDTFAPSRIAVDSLSAIERVATLKSFREFVTGLTSFVKEHECTGLFTATTSSLMGGTSVTEAHISTITDAIILLRYVELMGEMRRGLTVLKMRGSQHDKAIREFVIDATGMHVKQMFQNVTGILAGTPQHIASLEAESMQAMFSER